jgi:hypothetical protein
MPPKIRVRTLMLVVAAVAVFMGVVFPFFDAACHGPYATWFNRECQRRADAAGLVGRPEKDVAGVLGPPTFFYPGDDDTQRTYNYAPWPVFPTAKFQVHCHNGVVTSVEQFDD